MRMLFTTVMSTLFLFVVCSYVQADPTATGFKQTRDGWSSGDYESGFTDTVKMKNGEDRPTEDVILIYEVDIDEVDIIVNDRVTQQVEVTVKPGDWKAVGGHYEADVEGSDTFIKVQDFWTGDYDKGTVSRAFDAYSILSTSEGVIASMYNFLGNLDSVDTAFFGSAVVVVDRGDFDNDGLNLVEFDLSSAGFSDVDGKIMGTEFDLIQLVYDNGDDPSVNVGYLSPGHNTFFLIDMDDVFGTGKSFDILHFTGVALEVSGNRDDDSPAYDDEAGLVTDSSHTVYAFVDSIPGDFDLDGSVSKSDIGIFVAAWLTVAGEDGWNYSCDISTPRDSKIDLNDFAVFAGNWLEQAEPECSCQNRNFDLSMDGWVSLSDMNMLVICVVNGTCPDDADINCDDSIDQGDVDTFQTILNCLGYSGSISEAIDCCEQLP